MAEPQRGEIHVLRPGELYRASPLGLVGTIATGLMLGAFYIMAPIHAQRIGLNNLETAGLIGLVIAGGTALQWPLGWLSDRFDRRKVIVTSFALTTAICVAMALVGKSAILPGLGALFGGFAFALYPLCVAHTNDHVSVTQRIGASGGLVLSYSVGASLGPLIGAEAMNLIGPGGLYWFIGSVSAMAFVFGIWRQVAAPPVPSSDQGSFQVLPRTTPASAALDPEGVDQ
jgi:MFS family permease